MDVHIFSSLHNVVSFLDLLQIQVYLRMAIKYEVYIIGAHVVPIQLEFLIICQYLTMLGGELNLAVLTKIVPGLYSIG
jgi:hypothetical protein